MTDKEKTAYILQVLKLSRKLICPRAVEFPELRLGGGYEGISQRRIDFFIINSNDGYTTTAYEIKASRSDFKKDIANTEKQRGARLYANYFYFVAPKDMLRKEEIPDWAGLIEVTMGEDLTDVRPYDAWKLTTKTIPAPRREKQTPTWGMILSICRKYHKQLEELTKKE